MNERVGQFDRLKRRKMRRQNRRRQAGRKTNRFEKSHEQNAESPIDRRDDGKIDLVETQL